MSINSDTQKRTPSVNRVAPPLNRSDSHPQRLVLKTKLDNSHQSSSPAPPGSGHPTFHTGSNGVSSRRSRPETSHQKAVNMNRKMRIDHILHKKIRHVHMIAREERARYRSSFGLMVMNRIKDLPDMYDSEDENAWGLGGLLPNRREMEDFGEEALSYKKAIDRAIRRLSRQENRISSGGLVKSYGKGNRRGRSFVKKEENNGVMRKHRRDDAGRAMGFNGARDGGEREEALDDLDLALLGEGQDGDGDMDDESGGDDSEDGDMTEDEVMNEA